MTGPEALLWIAALTLSLLIGYAARRDPGGFWWGLLGPVGWIIAALHGIRDEIRAQASTALPERSTRTLAGGGQLPADTAPGTHAPKTRATPAEVR